MVSIRFHFLWKFHVRLHSVHVRLTYLDLSLAARAFDTWIYGLPSCFSFPWKKKNADYAENSGMENKSFNSLRHFLFQHDQNATASQKPCSELCFDFDKARWYFLFILNLWKSVLKKTGFIRGMKAYKSFLPVTRYAANPTETQLTIVLKSEVSNLVVCSWIGDFLFYLIHRKH